VVDQGREQNARKKGVERGGGVVKNVVQNCPQTQDNKSLRNSVQKLGTKKGEEKRKGLEERRNGKQQTKK